jgi:archaellum component FlaF (FlaF/FlaG flagellin family)
MKQNAVTGNSRIYNALMPLGWVIMVPGQSMILYSRLHLISPNLGLLRFIFWSIIVSAVMLCPPTATLSLRQYTKHPEPYTRGYIYMEKIQMTYFSIQEVFISCVYLWEMRKVMRVILDGKARKWMWQLVAMNIVLLILDVALLVMEYLNLYMIQTTFKGFLYSVKLKLEFAVLSQIVRVIQASNRSSTSAFAITLDEESDGTSNKAMSSVVSDVEIVQDNVPPEWRLSIGTCTIVSPVPIKTTRNELRSTSIISVDYPGRLG